MDFKTYGPLDCLPIVQMCKVEFVNLRRKEKSKFLNEPAYSLS